MMLLLNMTQVKVSLLFKKNLVMLLKCVLLELPIQRDYCQVLKKQSQKIQ